MRRNPSGLDLPLADHTAVIDRLRRRIKDKQVCALV
jgi:hypothetical protein